MNITNQRSIISITLKFLGRGSVRADFTVSNNGRKRKLLNFSYGKNDKYLQYKQLKKKWNAYANL